MDDANTTPPPAEDRRAAESAPAKDAPAKDEETKKPAGADDDDKSDPRWRTIGIPAAIVLVLALAIGGFLWWRHASHYESTDDAFVDGNITKVAAQVGGRVTEILFTDNQHVTAGQKLLQLDPRDLQAKLDLARAARSSAAADLAQANAQAAAQRAAVDEAGANIRVAEATQSQAGKENARLTALNPRAVTRLEVDNSNAALQAANARLDVARLAEKGARAQLLVIGARVLAANAAVQQADANQEAAELQLSYATITAPTAGRVTRRTVALGNVVSAGQPLFAIVQDGLWITANFKETQLARVRPGQKVEINIDAVPDRSFPGHVDSVQAGTGGAFSVLPAENATGNYVKVVQRVPVKITFDQPPGSQGPDQAQPGAPMLSPGMSSVPRVTVQ